MPYNVVLINQKLEGYWLVTEEYKLDTKADQIRVIKFDKCKKDNRRDKSCPLSWSYVDTASIHKNKLSKEIKKNWQPQVSSTYWVEKKKDKKTKRAVIHFEEYTNISLNVLKKELNIYLDSAIVLQAKKMK
jgi:hypothetical protein